MIGISLDSSRSANDTKQYKFLRLDSGLEVLIISAQQLAATRSGTDGGHKAAAAMCVQAGTFADPSLAEGCAHFLEHMLFMGIDSDKYPQSENLYDSFISSHGGSCNAFTEGEYTVYQFDVSAEHFTVSFDIFAQCFISPLLSSNSSDREIRAIESEFVLAKNSDSARFQQLVSDVAKDNHVLHKFSWGNKRSLATIPAENNLDINKVLRSFYKTHYVPSAMRLVVYDVRSIDEVEKDVIASFGSWGVVSSPGESRGQNDNDGGDDNNDEGPRKSPKSVKHHKGFADTDDLPSMETCIGALRGQNPFEDSAFKSLRRSIPVKKVHRLVFSWPLPPIVASYRSKPSGYLGHLLGHESAGSLLSALKSAGLVTAVSAGVSDGNFYANSMYSIFNVSITLTVKGLANWITVAERLFQYIAMLRKIGPQKWVHDELQQMSEIDYRFLDEEEESDFVERLSIEMAPYHQRDPADILTAPFLLKEWKPEEISAILDSMKADTCCIDLVSQAFASSTGATGSTAAAADGSAAQKEKTGKKQSTSDDEDDDSDGDEEDGDEDDDDEDDDEEEGEEDDDEDEDEEDDDDSKKNAAADVEISAELLKSLYEGPEQWLDLILPPTNNDITAATASAATATAATGSSAGSRTPSEEPHFGTLYWRDPLPAEVLQLWGNATPTPELHLPPKNQYIPKDTALTHELTSALQQQQQSAPTISSTDPVPVQIVAEAGLTVWHNIDHRFPVPKAQLYVDISSPVPVSSPKAAMMHEFVSFLLCDFLTELLYMAAMAHLECAINTTDVALELKVSGFSDNVGLLLMTVLEPLCHPEIPFVTAAIVDRQKELLSRIYNNTGLKSSEVARDARLLALKPTKCPTEKKLAALQELLSADSLTFVGEVKSHVKAFLSSANVRILAHGNLSSETVQQITKDVKKVLQSAGMSLSGDAAPAQPITQLPRDKALILPVAPRNPSEKNICIEAYYQEGAVTVELLTILELLEQCLTEPFFDALRTKQQLGYSVNCSIRQTYGMLGFCFQVVSSSYSCTDVLQAILSFVEIIPDLLQTLPESEFISHIESLVSNKLKPPTSLLDATSVDWSEITECSCDFLQHKKQAAILRSKLPSSLKEELLTYATQLFAESTRRLMIFQGSHDLNPVVSDKLSKAEVVAVTTPEAVHAITSTVKCRP